MLMQITIPGLSKLFNWPAFVLLMLCINVVGLLLKSVPWPRNKFIPWICLTLGCLIYPLVADVGVPKPEPHNWWVVRMVGLLVGAAAWLAHDRFLRRFEKYLNIPGLHAHGHRPTYRLCNHPHCPNRMKSKN